MTASLLLAAGCSKKLEGPTPTVEGVAPGAVCQSQITTQVAISGSGLSPLLAGHLKDQRLELPQVKLLRTLDVEGSAGSGEFLVPDDPNQAGDSRVRWTSQQQMQFEVFPELALDTGLYDVVLTNANGQSATFSGGLLSVPPPTVTSIAPDLLCGDKSNSFVVSGDFFVRSAAGSPRVRIGEQHFEPASMDECRALPGSGGFEACRKISVNLPEDAFSAGVYKVVVENPEPVGCASTEDVQLTIVPEPTLASVVPDLVCTSQGENTITLTGTGFLTVDGTGPTVTLSGGGSTLTLDAAASNCSPVEGPKETVQSCTTLTVVLPQDALSPEDYLATVNNPAPADCSTHQNVRFVVVPEPTLVSVVPELACTAEGERSITLNGTGFLTVDGTTPKVTFTDGTTTLDLTSVASDCSPVGGPVETVQSCNTLTVSLAQNAMPSGPYQVQVTNPDPAGCHSEQKVTFTAVPAPIVASVQPDISCADDGPVTLTVTGENFLRVAGTEPTVLVGGQAVSTTASNCTALAGPTANVETCTTLAAIIPQGSAAGVHDVVVTNPDPAGCSSAIGPKVTLFGRPEISSVQPVAMCTQASTREVVLTGTGFIKVGTGTPTVTVATGSGVETYASTLSNCTAVQGTSVTAELCTQLTFTAASDLPLGVHDVTVSNPAPVACASSGNTTLEITPPPTITAAQPATICAGGEIISLTGTHFTQGMSVTLTDASGAVMAHAQTVTVTSSTSATAEFASGIPTNHNATPWGLTVSSGGCSDTWGPPNAAGITVVPGPQIFFVDPGIVYNGINTVATVYGTGFTGSVEYVKAVEQATGMETTLTLYPQTRANQIQVLLPQGMAAGVYDLVLKDTTTCETSLASALTVASQTTFALASPAMSPPFGMEGDTTGVEIYADPSSTFLPVPRVYLNPVNTTGNVTATALGAVSIVNGTTLSALVPGTLTPGDYDLIVVNPDATVGVAPNAFAVVSQAPPTISTVSPGSLPNNGGVSFDILGADFRQGANVSLTCFDATGAPATAPVLTTPTVTSNLINVGVGATSAAACVVRVTNTDNNTYADFSSLVFTNSSKNLYPAQSGPLLASARRAPIALGGNATSTARFLHVIGGDDGTGGEIGTVETSPLSLLGVPSPFFTQKTQLNQPRTLAAGARIGRWLYVAGGSQSSGGTTTRLNTVERAYVLDPEDRPEITNLYLDFNEGGGLGSGVWYYRVSAVMDGNDPLNPGGENLASDPFPVQIPSTRGGIIAATLNWTAIPNAATYRVYRSPIAGASAGTEELIAEVSGTSYVDAGGQPISTDRPLPIGSLGKWQTLTATLASPREGPGVAWGRDPADPTLAYLYVFGGRSDATTALNTYEYLPITLGSGNTQSPAAAFLSGGANSIGIARWQVGAAHATSELSPVFAPGDTWLYVLGGMNAGGTQTVSDAVAGKIQAGGQLTALTKIHSAGLGYAGYATMVAADLVFAFGGSGGAPSTAVASAAICGSGTGCNTPPNVANFNTGQSMLEARHLLGGTLHGAYIYVVGGATSTAAATQSTEYRIW